ncbi:MAG: hypothetical protein AAGN46_05675 [Acidobacteriota bacterium]
MTTNTADRAQSPEDAAPPITDWRGAGLLSLLVLALHGAIAAWQPMPGTFLKYQLAVRWLRDGRLDLERLVDFSPLYLVLSGLLDLLPGDGATLLHHLQLVVVAGSMGGLYALLTRRVARGLAAALVLVLALDRHLLVYTRVLEPEPWMLAFAVGLLLFGDPAERRRRRLAFAGLLGGLALATRPTLLPVVAMAAAMHLLVDRKRASLAERLTRAAWVAAPSALVFLGLFAWAGWATGDPRAPIMNPGTVFFEGNNPQSHGTSAIYPPTVVHANRHLGDVPDGPHQLYRDVARADAGDPALSPRTVNGMWSERARSFLLDRPAAAGERLTRKLRYALHSFRWHDVPTAWRLDSALRTPSVPWALIAALMLAGMALAARDWRLALLPYTLAASQLGVMLVFYVSARQRLLLLPAAAYFAAIAIDALRRTRPRWPWLLGALLFTLTLSAPDAAMRDELYRRRGFDAARVRLDALRALTAERGVAGFPQETLDAMAGAPWWIEWLRPAAFPQDRRSTEDRLADRLLTDLPADGSWNHDSARFDLAGMLLLAGRLDEATTHLEALVAADARVYRGGREVSDPRILLARALALQGRKDDALAQLEAALLERPDDAFALAEQAAIAPVSDPTGDDLLPALLVQRFGAMDARFLLGRAFLAHRRPAAAVEALAPLVEAFPQLREARRLLAVARGESGDLDGAIAELRAANEVGFEPIVLPARTADVVDRWAAMRADDPRARLIAARLLHQHGRFVGARRLLTPVGAFPPALRPTAEALLARLDLAAPEPAAAGGGS